MAQLNHETDKTASTTYKHSVIVRAGLKKAIKVERTSRWAELLILQLGLVAGVALAFVGQNDSGVWRAFLSEQWQVTLIALAAMSIGFGGAALLYQRLGHRQSDQLEEDYRALVARADSLLKSSEPRQHEQESESASMR